MTWIKCASTPALHPINIPLYWCENLWREVECSEKKHKEY